jgi:hypothetical protein
VGSTRAPTAIERGRRPVGAVDCQVGFDDRGHAALPVTRI